jgi:exopolysaccharide biosynthesis polyprenyl glycosylphosphotransferase
MGSTDSLLEVIENYKINQVILSRPVEKNSPLAKQLIEARLKGVEITDLPEMYQFLTGKIPIKYVPEAWFLESKRFRIFEINFMARIKRLMDILFSFLILALSLPFWPFIALAIKINSRGPLIYKQKRIGKNEAVFSLYKFRSMIDKAETDRAVWADENDKRIIFVGKVMRKLHLDELPQLLNVLKGEMSLVGPRPERPEFVQELKAKISYYSFRHIMKPGLTGWAQVNFPYASSVGESQEKLEYDLYYISRVNLLLDIRIFLKTVKAVIFGRKSKKGVEKHKKI